MPPGDYVDPGAAAFGEGWHEGEWTRDPHPVPIPGQPHGTTCDHCGRDIRPGQMAENRSLVVPGRGFSYHTRHLCPHCAELPVEHLRTVVAHHYPDPNRGQPQVREQFPRPRPGEPPSGAARQRTPHRPSSPSGDEPFTGHSHDEPQDLGPYTGEEHHSRESAPPQSRLPRGARPLPRGPVLTYGAEAPTPLPPPPEAGQDVAPHAPTPEETRRAAARERGKRGSMAWTARQRQKARLAKLDAELAEPEHEEEAVVEGAYVAPTDDERARVAAQLESQRGWQFPEGSGYTMWRENVRGPKHMLSRLDPQWASHPNRPWTCETCGAQKGAQEPIYQRERNEMGPGGEIESGYICAGCAGAPPEHTRMRDQEFQVQQEGQATPPEERATGYRAPISRTGASASGGARIVDRRPGRFSAPRDAGPYIGEEDEARESSGYVNPLRPGRR